MTDFALKALEFGVLGLCAITLILVWRVLQAEKKTGGLSSQRYPAGFLHFHGPLSIAGAAEGVRAAP